MLYAFYIDACLLLPIYFILEPFGYFYLCGLNKSILIILEPFGYFYFCRLNKSMLNLSIKFYTKSDYVVDYFLFDFLDSIYRAFFFKNN